MSMNKMMVPVKGKGLPVCKAMAVKSVLEAAPAIITSLTSIVESNNDRDVKICTINVRCQLENNRIDKAHEEKRWALDLKSEAIKGVLESKKIKSSQAVEVIMECIK